MSTSRAPRPEMASPQNAPHTPRPTLAPPPPEESGWTTVNAPDLIKFERPGQSIEGRLEMISTVELKGKKVVQFTIAHPGGRKSKLLGTYDLVQKLSREHVGMMVRIMLRGEDQEIKRGDNAMKVFDVQVKGTPAAPDRESAPITDEDIPF
jgi:hypothetical protein